MAGLNSNQPEQLSNCRKIHSEHLNREIVIQDPIFQGSRDEFENPKSNPKEITQSQSLTIRS